jgi:hypothetical protein
MKKVLNKLFYLFEGLISVDTKSKTMLSVSSAKEAASRTRDPEEQNFEHPIRNVPVQNFLTKNLTRHPSVFSPSFFPPPFRKQNHIVNMSHETVWFSRPRKYGKGSRQW